MALLVWHHAKLSPRMLIFIARRIAFAIPTLLIVITLSFFLMRLAPGSPFQNGRKLTPEIEHNIMAKYGMDRPLGVQYLNYLGGVARGDLGPSLKYEGKSVSAIIGESFPKSATLGLCALVLALAIGGPCGMAAALHQNGKADYFATLLTTIGICIPTFVIAPMLVLVFASWLGWLPTAGWGGPRNLILPVIVLAMPLIAVVTRLVRAGMIEVLRSNFIRTARAKGLSQRRILLHHALPAAVLPLVSYLGPACAGLLTGSLVVEQIFSLPGLGKYFVTSALQRDYTIVMGTVILYSALILTLNLVSDLVYALLDPRVRLT